MPNDRKVSSVGHDGQTIENVTDGREDTGKEAEDVGQKHNVSDDVKNDDAKSPKDKTNVAGDEKDDGEEENEDVTTIPSAPPAEELQEP